MEEISNVIPTGNETVEDNQNLDDLAKGNEQVDIQKTEPGYMTKEEVSNILERVKNDLPNMIKEMLDTQKSEQEKLASMSEKQKAEYERQKAEDELLKREKEITRRELKLTAIDILNEKGISPLLADIIHFENAEQVNSDIDRIEKVFRTAVEESVNIRLKGSTPKASMGNYSKANIDPTKMSYEQYEQYIRNMGGN